MDLALRSFVESVRRLIKLVGRPSKDELWSSIRISLIGIAILGILGFIIKFMSFLFLGMATR